MKLKILASIFLVLSVNLLLAQTDGMSYQAVIIDNNEQEIPGIDVQGNPLSEGNVAMRFSIINEWGDIEYQEIHETKTDPYGMINLIIGQGAPTGEGLILFTEIDWDATQRSLQVELSYEDSEFEFFSQKELFFVPFAWHRNITATGTLDVDGRTTLNNALDVTNQNPTNLSGSLTVDKETILNSSLEVTNESPASLSGTLTVNGVTQLNDSLIVANLSASVLTGTLTVHDQTELRNGLLVNNQSATQLTGTLEVDGESDFNSQLSVQNASPTTLTGSLQVDLETNLNESLTVHNESPTSLSGTLTVSGNTSLESDLEVANGSETSLSGNLSVTGAATFADTTMFNRIEVQNNALVEGNLMVDQNTVVNGNIFNNGAATIEQNLLVQGLGLFNDDIIVSGDLANFQNDLSVSGITNLRGTNITGQVNILGSNLSGGQSDFTAYPLRVTGGSQGISIEINGTSNSSSNYVTFTDGNNTIRGCIEGQTLSELENSWDFIWYQTTAALEEAFIVAEGVACGVQLDLGEAAVMAAEGVQAYAVWAEYMLNYQSEVGVNFSSGGADYAEWIPKSNRRDQLMPGMVVGIKNGRVSKNTEIADHFLAVSTNPIVVGNLPPNGNESDYARVAFLGQVPINVIGAVRAGDYILPSGNNDGLAISKSKSEMLTADYNQIIGVAWESSSNSGSKLINTGLGISKNELTNKISELESELAILKKEVSEIKNMLTGVQSVSTVEAKNVNSREESHQQLSTIASPDLTQAEFNAWLDDYGYIFENKMAELRDFFNHKEVDYSGYGELTSLIEKPKESFIAMYKGTQLNSLWEIYQERVANQSAMGHDKMK